jgi:hypothetical protein
MIAHWPEDLARLPLKRPFHLMPRHEEHRVMHSLKRTENTLKTTFADPP